jgi:hypothetical protein
MVVSKKNKSTIEERSGTGLASQVLCTCRYHNNFLLQQYVVPGWYRHSRIKSTQDTRIIHVQTFL